MTHTTSDELPNDSLQASTGQSGHPNGFLLPKLTPKRWGIALGGSVLLVGGIWGVLQFTQAPPPPEVEQSSAIAVATLRVQAQPMTTQLELSGTIHPVEQATLSTRVTGRITQLSLEAGDRFQKGDVLALIDVMDIAAQTSQAQSGVAQAQAEVARAQATLSQLESQKLEAQSALKLAQINQTRMAQLQAEGAIAQAQLDEANTTLDTAQARIAQTEAGIRQAEAAIAQSRAAVDQAESSVTSASVNESYGAVIAPFDGVVVQKLAYEGEMAAPGTALLKIENPNRLQLEISVPEDNLQFVGVGQSVQVRVDAVNQTLTAAIQQIVPAADPNSRSFLVKIPLKNPGGKLISGMFGRIVLPLSEKQDTLMIPTSALIQRGQLQGVYVVETHEGDRTMAVLRWIKTGKTQANQIEVVSGLATGDRIVTSNIDQLSDGQSISLHP